jgi:hypothetical protein
MTADLSHTIPADSRGDILEMAQLPGLSGQTLGAACPPGAAGRRAVVGQQSGKHPVLSGEML